MASSHACHACYTSSILVYPAKLKAQSALSEINYVRTFESYRQEAFLMWLSGLKRLTSKIMSLVYFYRGYDIIRIVKRI